MALYITIGFLFLSVFLFQFREIMISKLMGGVGLHYKQVVMVG